MDNIEKKIYKKYIKKIKNSVRNKYKKLANKEALEKKIYLNKDNCSENFSILKNDIYKSYIPLINDEINSRIENILNDIKFQNTVEIEKELSKKKLHFKALKKYQKLPIHISEKFLDELFLEVNSGIIKKSDIINKKELKYLTLLIFYAIIDNIKQGKIIKFGTIFRIWCNKRDFISNLPNIEEKIKLDMFFPKLELCYNFNNRLFKLINIDNEAILNFYKAKTDRYLKHLRKNEKK